MAKDILPDEAKFPSLSKRMATPPPPPPPEDPDDDDEDDEDDDEVRVSADDREFINDLERAKIVLFLEETLCIACYDSESLSLLRSTLMANVKDGSVDVDDVRGFMDQIDDVEASLERKGVTEFEMKVIKAGII